METKNEGYTTKAAKIPTEYHGVFQRQREVSWCSSYKPFLVCNHVTIGGHAGGQNNKSYMEIGFPERNAFVLHHTNMAGVTSLANQ